MFWNKKEAKKIVEQALKEDLHWQGDITSDNLLPFGHQSRGKIISKEKGVLAGNRLAELVFAACSSEITFQTEVKDGNIIEPGEIVAIIDGSTRSILAGERTALNFLQRLSGIATKTRKYIDRVAEYPVRITDTRKTTPTLRMLEKYAVRMGGAHNHRPGLYSTVMIKDNHIVAAGSIKKAIKSLREEVPHTTKIEVEVEDKAGLQEALEAGADIIMLDNMKPEKLKEMVNLVDKRAILEASGGITLENIVEYAQTGVDIISVGALTHQISSLDLGLDLENI